MKLAMQPLTAARWNDLEQVFGARGCSEARRCWCMYYRVTGRGPAAAPGQSQADANHDALAALADLDSPAGLLGYQDGEALGWVSLGPRSDYAKLATSPVMKPVDDVAVWSIVCFVVPSAHRGQGVARALLRGAIAYARGRDVACLEAYPLDSDVPSAAKADWFGSRRMFAEAGFSEIARRRADRPIMRLPLR